MFEGDLNIPQLQEASRDDAEFKTVLAASKFAGRWPNGVMPYVISSVIGEHYTENVLHACKCTLKFFSLILSMALCNEIT